MRTRARGGILGEGFRGIGKEVWGHLGLKTILPTLYRRGQ
jgi:hypothetical protein